MYERVGLREAFKQELSEWAKTGKAPESAGQSIHYALDLQKKRLEERGLQMELSFEKPRKESDYISGGSSADKRRQSLKYSNQTEYEDNTRKLSFFKNGKRKFHEKEWGVFYTITTFLRNESIDGSETYCCPSCGAISTILQLQDGCPYCQTKYKITDLFPKVSYFYFMKSPVEKRSKLLAKVKWVLLLGALLGLLLQRCGIWIPVEAGIGIFHLIQTIGAIVFSMLLGMLLIYVAYACLSIMSLFGKAIFSIKPLAQNKEAERKINQLLGGFDPSFSYPYFISQLISTLKIITFTKDRTNLPQYTGSNPHTDLDNIIEMAFNGVLKLNHYTVQNGYCTLNLEMGMDVVREDGNKIKTKAELYRMTIVKNVAKLEDIHFSVKRVECKKCGGSFDAMKEKVCPYCGENYDYKEDDWMVLQLEKL